MCLLNKSGNILAAKTDLVCYKVLYKDFISSIQRYQYIIGKRTPLVKLYLQPFKNPFCINPLIQKPKNIHYTVNKGYHSYTPKKLENIISKTNYSNSSRKLPYQGDLRLDIIVKCIIPKGTKYIISMDKEEYVSETIIVQKRIL